MAVFLTWALFALWLLVGTGVLAAARFRRPLQLLLLAPTVGFATVVVPSFLLTRAGLPVRAFAVPLLLALTGAAAAVLWRTRLPRDRARLVWRRARPFAAVLVAASVLPAWPMFGYGFDWVANGNDDMASYCLGSAGFRDHGFVAQPTAELLRSGTDDSHYLWFMHRYADVRCGVELLLATASAVTGLTTQQAYMPTIVALNLALVAAAAGLVLGGGAGARRRAAVWAAALLAVSGPNTYAIIQQVIAQVSGIALLCCSAAMFGRRCRRVPRAVLARRAAASGLVLAGFAICYPEAVPFLAGTAGVYGLVRLLGGRLERAQLAHAAAAGVLAVALLPLYILGAAGFLLMQMSHGAGTEHSDLLAQIFPYFLVPRGGGTLWGIFTLTGPVPEPYQSVLIGVGLALVAGGMWLAVTQAGRGRVFAATLVTMTAAGLLLAGQRNGFGMFKLAMFAQPFLWAAVAYWLAAPRSRVRFAVAACGVLALAGANARTQYEYVRQSVGREHRVGIPEVTRRHLMSDFRREIRGAADGHRADRFVIASENNALVKLLESHTRGTPTAVVGMDLHLSTAMAFGSDVRPGQDGWRVVARLAELAAGERPWVTDPGTGAPIHQLVHTPPDWRGGPGDRVYLIAAAGGASVFNRTRYPGDGSVAVLEPMSGVRDFVCFRDAKGARQNYHGLATPWEIGLFEMEADPAIPRRPMVGVGKALVLEVLNPSPRVRLVAEWTSSYQADPAERVLPPAQVIGDRRVPLGAVGLGAARLVSPPLGTQAVGAAHILVIDFGAPPASAPNRLTGAEKLWGADLPRDRRHLTGHARDISVVSDEEYAAFRPPERVAAFPAGLAHPHLEYAGVFEEGWVGRACKFRLTQPAGHEVVVRGTVPGLPGAAGFRTEAVLLVDGAEVERRTLGPGDFELRAAATGGGPRWVEVRFSADQRLPDPDGRSLVAHLASVGFEPSDPRLSRPPERLTAFPGDLSHPKLSAAGIDADGWVGHEGKARLWFDGPGREVVVRGNVPAIAAAFRTDLTMLVDGTEVGRRALAPGDFEVRLPAPAGPVGPRWVEVRFSAVQPLPAPDTRATAARLYGLGFEPVR